MMIQLPQNAWTQKIGKVVITLPKKINLGYYIATAQIQQGLLMCELQNCNSSGLTHYKIYWLSMHAIHLFIAS